MGILKMTPTEIFMPQEVLGKILNERVQVLKSSLMVTKLSEVLPSITAPIIPVNNIVTKPNSLNKNSDALFWIGLISGTAAVGGLLYLYQSGYFRARKSIRKR